MRGFIEITTLNRKRLLNTRHIEDVVEHEDGCCIYVVYDCPNALEQDCFELKETYEEIKEKIQEAVGK